MSSRLTTSRYRPFSAELSISVTDSASTSPFASLTVPDFSLPKNASSAPWIAALCSGPYSPTLSCWAASKNFLDSGGFSASAGAAGEISVSARPRKAAHRTPPTGGTW